MNPPAPSSSIRLRPGALPRPPAVIAAIVTAVVLAQGPAPQATPVSAEAEALFKAGLTAFDERQYARAIASFEAAYRLQALPEILFDIALAHKATGDCQRAAGAFDHFIAVAAPESPLLPRARARRAELGSCAPASVAVVAGSTQPPAFVAARASAPPTPVLVAPPPPSSPRPGSAWLRNVCVASAGGAAVLALGGTIFGVQALSAQHDAQDAAVWDEAAQRADERGRTLGQAATGLFVSAGVMGVVAAATCLLRR